MNLESKESPRQGKIKKVTEAITIISYIFKLITLVSFDNLWKYIKSSNTHQNTAEKKKSKSLKEQKGIQTNKL